MIRCHLSIRAESSTMCGINAGAPCRQQWGGFSSEVSSQRATLACTAGRGSQALACLPCKYLNLTNRNRLLAVTCCTKYISYRICILLVVNGTGTTRLSILQTISGNKTWHMARQSRVFTAMTETLDQLLSLLHQILKTVWNGKETEARLTV